MQHSDQDQFSKMKIQDNCRFWSCWSATLLFAVSLCLTNTEPESLSMRGMAGGYMFLSVWITIQHGTEGEAPLLSAVRSFPLCALCIVLTTNKHKNIERENPATAKFELLLVHIKQMKLVPQGRRTLNNKSVLQAIFSASVQWFSHLCSAGVNV